jgi:hypothetical protein
MTDGHTYQIAFPSDPAVYVGILTAGTDGQPTLSSPGILGAPTAMPQQLGIIVANAPGYTQTYSFSADGSNITEPTVTVRQLYTCLLANELSRISVSLVMYLERLSTLVLPGHGLIKRLLLYTSPHMLSTGCTSPVTPRQYPPGCPQHEMVPPRRLLTAQCIPVNYSMAAVPVTCREWLPTNTALEMAAPLWNFETVAELHTRISFFEEQRRSTSLAYRFMTELPTLLPRSLPDPPGTQA